MADFVKCACPSCGVNYRLPVEFQGRTAKCKRCGNKFEVPKEKSMDESVLDWLRDDAGDEDETVAQPRVVTMPKEPDSSASTTKPQGVIRMKKEQTPKTN